MTHVYEDADQGIQFIHEEDFSGNVVIDKNGEQITIPGPVVYQFIMSTFGIRMKAALDKTISEVFSDLPLMCDELT